MVIMQQDILFSLFMFTANVQPQDEAYGDRLLKHMRHKNRLDLERHALTGRRPAGIDGRQAWSL